MSIDRGDAEGSVSELASDPCRRLYLVSIKCWECSSRWLVGVRAITLTLAAGFSVSADSVTCERRKS
jgi:hypothetical protein